MIASGVSLILRLDPLHLCKQLFPDDRRATTLNADVAVLLSVVISFPVCSCRRLIEHKNTGVFLIAEYFVQTVFPEHFASFCLVTMGVQIVDDRCIAITLCKHLKDDFYRLCFRFIDNQMPVFIQIVSQRRTAASVFTLQSSLIHALHNFPCQVLAVVLGHALQNRFHHNALRRVVHAFQHTAKLDMVLL